LMPAPKIALPRAKYSTEAPKKSSKLLKFIEKNDEFKMNKGKY